jgi:hypothetical protein
MESNLMDRANIKQIISPVDLAAGVNTGARLSMKNVLRVTIIASLGPSTTGDTPTLNFRQHDAAASGNSKALPIGQAQYVKNGTETKFTKTAIDTKTDSFVLTSDLTADGGIAVFEVLAEDLDRDLGFTHISVDMPDAGANVKLGEVLAIVYSKNAPAYDLDI